jgi:predicted MPP superfamily phosphohydrolase
MTTATQRRSLRPSPTTLLFLAVPWSGCALVSAAETLLLEWAWSVREGPLDSFSAARGFLALFSANLLLLMLLRRYARRRRAALLLGRAFLLASFGALVSGSLLALSHAGLALAGSALVSLPVAALDATRLGAGVLALLLGYGCIGWGAIVGPRRLVIERVRMPMPGVGPQLARLRIAHLTDLHIGPQLPPARVRDVVERVNALEPDLIAITGDIFDFDPRFIAQGCRELARLRAPRGVYAVLGNHDVYTGADAVAAGFREHTQIRLLRDRAERLEVGGEALYLLGIDDPGRGITERELHSEALERLARETPAGAARLLLVHRPSYLRQIASLGLPAALAGHTHGGQISLPRPAHQHNIARLTSNWTRGMFCSGQTLLYVNRGLGVTTVPLRLNCPREIALIELAPLGAKNDRERCYPRPQAVDFPVRCCDG